jgi:hypothetical protein
MRKKIYAWDRILLECDRSSTYNTARALESDTTPEAIFGESKEASDL